MLDPETKIIEAQRNIGLQEMLYRFLTPKEHRVLTLRYGLMDGQEQTYAEIGKVYNLSRTRIQQIERKAVRKLGSRAAVRRWRRYVDVRQAVVAAGKHHVPQWMVDAMLAKIEHEKQVRRARQAKRERQIRLEAEWQKSKAEREYARRHQAGMYWP